MKINIEIIPHQQHRNPDTIGDYWWDGDTLEVRSSDLDNPFHEFLIVCHEINEALLCLMTRVSINVIDAWDKAHPPVNDYDEPGDDPAAPYARQHAIAAAVERLAAQLIGVNYQEYDNRLGDFLKHHRK